MECPRTNSEQCEQGRYQLRRGLSACRAQVGECASRLGWDGVSWNVG